MNATCSMNPNLTLQHQVGSMEGSGEPASPASPENRSGCGQGHPWGAVLLLGRCVGGHCDTSLRGSAGQQ